jgi:tRNA A-37 threonylcarbamoyl transferase component Bud32
MNTADDDRLWDLLAAWEEQYRRGRDIPAEELCRDCPALAEEAAACITSLKRMDWLLKREDDDDPAPLVRPLNFGEYTVLEKVGAGGMGEVFKALHRRMDRIVALKILPERTVQSAEALARFQQEIQSAARLTHPNIVHAYDAGEIDGKPFLAMEYVEGSDLFRHVREHGPLPVAQAVDYVTQAAGGLEYAHGKGVIHRDIKPSNLLLGADGTVKVLDMGLARIRAAPADEAVMGTADFLAPEQTVEPRQADRRSDIYGLGCTLFFLLTGQPLFQGKTVLQKVLAHREQPAPSLRQVRPEVTGSLDAVFRRLVAKRPEDRYRSMAEVTQALQRAGSKGSVINAWLLMGTAAVALLLPAIAWFFGLVPGVRSPIDPTRASPDAGRDHTQEPANTQPRILQGRTMEFEEEKENYARYNDLTFEVGIGPNERGRGHGYSGIEVENTRRIKLSVDASPAFRHRDTASFAGFFVDYHTKEGFTKRVGLSIGVYDENRPARRPPWGKFTPPDEYVDLLDLYGRNREYDLDLQRWAPPGWDGKAWFTVIVQNSGKDTYLKATATIPGL